MRLEDNLRYNLFRTSNTRFAEIKDYRFIIECKAEKGKPVPLCIPRDAFVNSDLVYRKLYLIDHHREEKSTPRALFNTLFSGYMPANGLIEAKVKDSMYYSAPGVLFTNDKKLLFYFASDGDEGNYVSKLYITPTLLVNATVTGNPMEKFFMSTIVPYLINHIIYGIDGRSSKLVIDIDNFADNTFFIPRSRMVASTPIDKINDKLNDILANNADVLSAFTDNYANIY